MQYTFIYGLIDPRTLMVRYIGQTRSGHSRPRQHRWPSQMNRTHSHKNAWLKTLPRDESGSAVYDVVVLEYCEPEQLNDAERWWVRYGRLSRWPLTNYGDGGQYDSFWETRRAVREKLKTRWRDRQRAEMVAWRIARGVNPSNALGLSRKHSK